MYEIFGADWCVFCEKAKKLLTDKKCEFVAYDVDEMDAEEELKVRMNLEKFSIPQIWKDGIHIGGYSELVKII